MANTQQYTYTFLGWDGYTDGISLTDDITFIAVYRYKDYNITAEGLADAITVTYNSDFAIQPQTPKEEYLFIGYFTEKDGAGIQVTNEKGESIAVYNTVGDLNVYPYFESVYMNKIVLSETTPTILDGEFTQKLLFATKTVNVIAYAKINSLDFGNGVVLTEFNPDARKYTVYVKENATSISLTPTFSGGGVLRSNGSGVWF